jgi:hypothetical protein
MDSGLPRYAPKSALADLGTIEMRISGRPEIGGHGMTNGEVDANQLTRATVQRSYTASRSLTAPSRSTDTSCEMPRSAMVTP